ncbi:MAG: pyridoxal-phosphate dependent enzyme [Planctomycetes bacterium]|nr:pyridoxal-phosphate dependent enzyme [Planctomycetota bacterium]
MPQLAVSPVTLETIRNARQRIASVTRRTPLLEVTEPLAAKGIPGRWFLKLECLQHGGAFKFRGVHARLSKWTEEGDLPQGVVTFSSGNHGLAVANASKRYGIQAVICVPETVPQAKFEAMRAAGARVIRAGLTSAHRRAAALEVERRQGFRLIEPFDDVEVISGQGTIALEVLEELPELTDFVVPVGGGGLFTGTGVAFRSLAPRVRMHAVEPEGCDSFARSARAGRRVEIDPAPSLADGLRPVAPGALIVEIGLPLAFGLHAVDDQELLDAMRFLQHPLHVVAEPSGAAPMAALLSGRLPADERTVGVLVISGGNTDWSKLAHRLWPRTTLPLS